MTSENSSLPKEQSFYNVTLKTCAGKYESFNFPINSLYCNWTFDLYLCWPPVQAGEVAVQNCPATKGLDPTKSAERRCDSEGRWMGRNGASDDSSQGWTNFTNCYLPEFQSLLKRMGSNPEIKMKIAEWTRILEIIGFSLSLIALIVSLAIFYRFRSLRNNRTWIHKNLFIAMVIQVLIRLTLYIDQAVTRQDTDKGATTSTRYSIDNTLYLCEAAYILLEYARTAMFLWMFIEGLYLHNVVTVTVFQGKFPHLIYAVIGWGSPVVMTTIWAGYTAISKFNQKCWFGYNLTPYYWILEGPRLIVILTNFVFLLNIIRVLVVKLRQRHTSDIEQVRKAVRAAFVLLPLLGITNLLNMAEAPLDGSPQLFASWSFITHFLTSFQGFFVAMIYCFLNGEVRVAIMKSISVYMSLRGHHDWAMRRTSFFSGNYPTNAEVVQQLPIPTGIGENSTPNLKPKNNTKIKKNWLRLFFLRKQIEMQRDQPPESVVFDIVE